MPQSDLTKSDQVSETIGYLVIAHREGAQLGDVNHVFFENEIGAATSIYEQYKLRTQQNVKSSMITRIIEWDYFQQLLEDYLAYRFGPKATI